MRASLLRRRLSPDVRAHCKSGSMPTCPTLNPAHSGARRRRSRGSRGARLQTAPEARPPLDRTLAAPMPGARRAPRRPAAPRPGTSGAQARRAARGARARPARLGPAQVLQGLQLWLLWGFLQMRARPGMYWGCGLRAAMCMDGCLAADALFEAFAHAARVIDRRGRAGAAEAEGSAGGAAGAPRAPGPESDAAPPAPHQELGTRSMRAAAPSPAAPAPSERVKVGRALPAAPRESGSARAGL